MKQRLHNMFAKLWRRLGILRAQVVGVTPARSFILALELLYFATLDSGFRSGIRNSLVKRLGSPHSIQR
jgi:hypothetical protein